MTSPPYPPPDLPGRPDPPGGPEPPSRSSLPGGPDLAPRPASPDGQVATHEPTEPQPTQPLHPHPTDGPADTHQPTEPQPTQPLHPHPTDGPADTHQPTGPQPTRPFHPHTTDGPVDMHVSAIPPEARAFQGARAGLVSRVAANTVDFGVVAAILAAGYAAVAALRFMWNSRTFSFPTAPFALLLLLGGAVTIVYLTGSWMTTGRTYGDHLFGLRVINPWGRPLRIGGALIRAVLCVVFPIGLFWVAVSRENRSLQDVLLRTSVIYDWGVIGRAGTGLSGRAGTG